MSARSCRNSKWRRFVKFRLTAQLLIAAIASPLAAPAAASDLLVAPTRLTFEGRERSTEVILKNIGEQPATYRISLVLRRMEPDGSIVEVGEPSEAERLAEEMIRFAPRRIRLEPAQPQAVRVAVRKPADLPDGEYRVHMMFRAIPDAAALTPETVSAPSDQLTISLTPIYGVTIPLIVRHGEVAATARIAEAAAQDGPDGRGIMLTLEREGNRSVYGDVEILFADQGEPSGFMKGIAIYPEVNTRSIFVPLESGGDAAGGPATVRYYETKGGRRVLLDEHVVPLG